MVPSGPGGGGQALPCDVPTAGLAPKCPCAVLVAWLHRDSRDGAGGTGNWRRRCGPERASREWAATLPCEPFHTPVEVPRIKGEAQK